MPGLKTPVLLGWARVERDHPPSRMVLEGLALCEPCAEAATPSDFISDEGWEQIVAAHRAMGKADPIREATGLAWEMTS